MEEARHAPDSPKKAIRCFVFISVVIDTTVGN